MNKKIKSLIIYFKYVIKDKKRKPLYKIVYELIRCAIKERSVPSYYFTVLLYRKGKDRYLDHISHKTANKLKSKLNDSNYKPILENKIIFQNYFSNYDIQIPKMLGYSFKKCFFVSNNRFYVENYDDFKNIIKNIIINSSSNSIFIKPVDGHCGRNTYKFNNIDLNVGENKLRELFKNMNSYDFLFQETVNQNSKLSKMHDSSLNTIRLHTFVNDEGIVEIISAYIRFGKNGSIVDNGGGGGFAVPVDLDKGTLLGKGFNSLKSGGKEYKKHPNTGIILNGYKIPYFEKAKELVIKAGSYVPSVRLVGWDVGITNSGPILIEGNANFHLLVGDLSEGGLRKNKVFKKVLLQSKIP